MSRTDALNADGANRLRARIVDLEAERGRLLFALRTIMGDAEHGQDMTWNERCRVARDAIAASADAEPSQ